MKPLLALLLLFAGTTPAAQWLDRPSRASRARLTEKPNLTAPATGRPSAIRSARDERHGAAHRPGGRSPWERR